MPWASCSRWMTRRCVIGIAAACPSKCSKPEKETTTFAPSPAAWAMAVTNCSGGNVFSFMGLPFGDGCVDQAFSVISYNPATGFFHWTNPPNKASGIRPGDIAGYVMRNGYRRIGINGESFKAHRLAWLFTYGGWPEGQIDHINGNRDDNRIKNLRDVTHLINAQNRRIANKNNSNGFLGVSATKGRFMATICIDSKKKYLGTFGTPEEAHAAYRAAKVANHEGCTL